MYSTSVTYCSIYSGSQYFIPLFSLVLQWIHCLVVSKMSITALSYKHSTGIQIEVCISLLERLSDCDLWQQFDFQRMLLQSLCEPKQQKKLVLKWIILIDGAEITEKSVVLVTSAVHCGLSVKFYLTHFACDSCNDKSTVTHLRWICFAE